jgi:hypothetical protein
VFAPCRSHRFPCSAPDPWPAVGSGQHRGAGGVPSGHGGQCSRAAEQVSKSKCSSHSSNVPAVAMLALVNYRHPALHAKLPASSRGLLSTAVLSNEVTHMCICVLCRSARVGGASTNRSVLGSGIAPSGSGPGSGGGANPLTSSVEFSAGGDSPDLQNIALVWSIAALGALSCSAPVAARVRHTLVGVKALHHACNCFSPYCVRSYL